MSRTIFFVGCSKRKLKNAQPDLLYEAKELYRGPNFLAAKYVLEECGKEWLILSAGYGVLNPTDMIAPYDVTIRSRYSMFKDINGIPNLEGWRKQLRSRLCVVLASEHYATGLERLLGRSVECPFRGLQAGEMGAAFYGLRGIIEQYK